MHFRGRIEQMRQIPVDDDDLGTLIAPQLLVIGATDAQRETQQQNAQERQAVQSIVARERLEAVSDTQLRYLLL